MRNPDNYPMKHRPVLKFIEPGKPTSDWRIYVEGKNGNLVFSHIHYGN